MGQFTIRVSPDVIQERVTAAQTRDIDRLAQQFQLDKTQIQGDGVDLDEAAHLPFDTFMQLSGGDAKITKGDLLKFAGTETAKDIVLEYAHQVADSLPAKVMDSASDSAAALEFKVTVRGSDIMVRAERQPLTNEAQPPNDPTAAGVFSIIGGRDANNDGQITVAGELSASAFVNTVGDAIKIAGSDMQISPTEALKAVFERAGKVPLPHVEIDYSK